EPEGAVLPLSGGRTRAAGAGGGQDHQPRRHLSRAPLARLSSLLHLESWDRGADTRSRPCAGTPDPGERGCARHGVVPRGNAGRRTGEGAESRTASARGGCDRRGPHDPLLAGSFRLRYRRRAARGWGAVGRGLRKAFRLLLLLLLVLESRSGREG